MFEKQQIIQINMHGRGATIPDHPLERVYVNIYFHFIKTSKAPEQSPGIFKSQPLPT